MRRGPILAAVLLLAACGREGKAPREPERAAEAVPYWAKVAPEQIEAAKVAGVPVAFENSIGMRFVLIPAGTFTMGSPLTEKGRGGDETQHEVTLTRPYYIGVTEVTNGEFRRWRPVHDSGDYEGHWLNEDVQPVVSVSWNDAVTFAKWLGNSEPGRSYRLPTEAGWERACRAGTTTARFWGEEIDAAVRFANVPTSRKKRLYGWRFDVVPAEDLHDTTSPVGDFEPNAWGAYDTLGNVAEFCADLYAHYSAEAAVDPSGPPSGQYRIVRGGGWVYPLDDIRAAYRGRREPGTGWPYVGFRLALSLPSK